MFLRFSGGLALAALAFLGVTDAIAKGGQQTWILVCPASLSKDACNLTTASRWYHLPTPQASAETPAIRAARAKVGQGLEAGFYVSQEQFPAGVSMGPHAAVFKACADDVGAPDDAEAAEWARRGECLR